MTSPTTAVEPPLLPALVELRRTLRVERMILVAFVLGLSTAWAIAALAEELLALQTSGWIFGQMFGRGLEPAIQTESVWLVLVILALAGLVVGWRGDHRFHLERRELRTANSDVGVHLRLLERLPEWLGSVRRAREVNVWLAVGASLIAVGALLSSSLGGGAPDLAARLLGVWWLVPFVAPVVLVWLAMSLAHRKAEAAARTEALRLGQDWGPLVGTPQGGREPPVPVAAAESEAPTISSRLSSLACKAQRTMEAQGAVLLVSFAAVAGIVLVWVAMDWWVQTASPSGGSWLLYEYAIGLLGLIPLGALAMGRLGEAAVAGRETARAEVGPPTSTAAPPSKVFELVERTAGLVSVSRRLSDATLEFWTFSLIWLILVMPTIDGDVALRSGGPLAYLDVLLRLLPIPLAVAFLFVWWWNRIRVLRQAGRTRTLVDGMTDLERDLWERF